MRGAIRRWRGWFGIVLCLLLLGAAVFIPFQQRWFVLFHMHDSQAMWPTIRTGDLVLAETITLRFREPSAGQLIIFDSAGMTKLEELRGVDPPWLYVQRLVAAPGNQVSIHAGELRVDGTSWHPVEWDGQIQAGPFLEEEATVVVPPKNYFVIADQYSIAQDSRHWGWVPRENVVARVLWVFRNE